MKESGESGVSRPKKIALLCDDRSMWGRIEEILGSVNAQVVVLDRTTPAEKIKAEAPDLLILPSVREDEEGEKGPLAEYPRLILRDVGEPGHFIQKGSQRKVYELTWPAPKVTLLELTGRLLSLSERREFKAIVGIERRGGGTRSLGESLNFSQSGLAFTSDTAFEEGELIVVSFFISSVGKRVHFDAEIVRSLEGAMDGDRAKEGKKVYGAMFKNLSMEDRDALDAFITRRV